MSWKYWTIFFAFFPRWQIFRFFDLFGTIGCMVEVLNTGLLHCSLCSLYSVNGYVWLARNLRGTVCWWIYWLIRYQILPPRVWMPTFELWISWVDFHLYELTIQEQTLSKFFCTSPKSLRLASHCLIGWSFSVSTVRSPFLYANLLAKSHQEGFFSFSIALAICHNLILQFSSAIEYRLLMLPSLQSLLGQLTPGFHCKIWKPGVSTNSRHFPQKHSIAFYSFSWWIWSSMLICQTWRYFSFKYSEHNSYKNLDLS